MLIFDLIDEGILSMDSTIIFEVDDYEVSAGYLTSDYDLGDAIPLSYLTYESLYYSSNTASRMLYKALGGFSEFKALTTRYSDIDYASTGETNLINVDFLLDVLDHFYTNGHDYPMIYQWLGQAMPDDYGALYLDVPMIHKYGHYQTNINDCGLIMAPIPFSFVVLTSDMSEIDVGNIVAIMYEYTLFSS